MRRDDIRNIAIIAHVDHGKTTLVDCMLRAGGEYRPSQLTGERILDNNELERERGITILAKNIALTYEGVKINLIDTPGHADFGGEVERVLGMANGALVLIDAAEGPMPQTRFVLTKALECGLKPVVVINKIDRPDARCDEALNEVFELLVELGADDDVLDFPYIFTSAKEDYATTDPDQRGTSMKPLLDLILREIPGPEVHPEDPLQMLVTTIDWSEYVGRIAVGRLLAGEIRQGQRVALIQKDHKQLTQQITELHVFDKLGRCQVEKASAGDIVAVVGLGQIEIGDTISQLETPRALPRLEIDPPTLEMIFAVNTSPMAGRDGTPLTSRQLRERLYRELQRNVALKVRPVEGTETFAVAGRGVLHLAVLIETIRREGFELSIGKPRVITRKRDGKIEEPFETLVIDVPPEKLGPVMDLIGPRRGETVELGSRGDMTHVVYSIPARGLIGLRTRILNATQGTATMHHRFSGYRSLEGEVPSRSAGVLVSAVQGHAVAFALDGLQDRAELFVAPGDPVYEGMIVGENCRGNEMVVNPTKQKKLTNMRAAGTDRNLLLKPPRDFSLEQSLEYIEDDELVEVTPKGLRLRKILLSEAMRRQASRRRAS
jgi:GTP-binding protein